jgi:predicted nucleic acid-binding protein
VSLFVDTSVFYAVVDKGDSNHARATEILGSGEALVTTDHVMVETWLLARSRLGFEVAEQQLGIMRNGASIEPVKSGDLEVAWAIGESFPDQEFSIVDRTSFAVMQRLGVLRAASFDDDFAIFRYGRKRDRAFEVVR